MPSSDYIQHSLTGAARLMLGRKDGTGYLDLSADGFWTSFFAVVVAVPAFMVGWVTLANELAWIGSGFADRLSLTLRLALIDVAAWVLPIGLLALVARPAGIANRFVHYVVASNWGSAILAWLMLPPSLVRLFWPQAGDAVIVLSLGLFLVCMVLLWRLTNAALDKGPAIATGVFAGVFLSSLIVTFALQAVLGVVPIQ